MKSFNIFFAIAIIFLTDCGNSSKNSKIKWIDQRNFLAFYQTKILKLDSIAVYQIIKSADAYSDLREVLNTDSLKTKVFSGINLKKWRSTDFQNTTLINEENLLETAYHSHKFEKIFETYKGFFQFSAPMFSQDKNYAIIYIDFICGSRCGYSQVELYRREGNVWKLLQVYNRKVA